MDQPPLPLELIQKFKTASSVVALTGAGISAESGVPTFRDAQTGLWSRYQAEELATPQAFRQNPGLVWEWYSWRRERISQAEPNPAHFALVEMEKRLPDFILITQNVDGLHQRAGSGFRFPLIELHGNIQRSRCSVEDKIFHHWQQQDDGLPPRCPDCGEFLRPDVVWFGEMLPRQALDSAQFAAAHCEIFLSIGTSALVEPAASLPFIALRQKAVVVEINPEHTPLTSSANFHLPYASGFILPYLVRFIWET